MKKIDPRPSRPDRLPTKVLPGGETIVSGGVGLPGATVEIRDERGVLIASATANKHGFIPTIVLPAKSS